MDNGILFNCIHVQLKAAVRATDSDIKVVTSGPATVVTGVSSTLGKIKQITAPIVPLRLRACA